MGNEPAAHPNFGNSVYAKGRQGALRPSLSQSIPLGMHHLYPRYVNTPTVVGRGLCTDPGLLQLDASSWRCCTTSAARVACQRDCVATSYESIDAMPPVASRLAVYRREAPSARR